MYLVNIYDQPGVAPDTVIEFLYKLLQEREPVANISHREMPTMERHAAFVRSQPYQAWYIIAIEDVDWEWVGAIYLTHTNEIGISILKEAQGNCYGPRAIRMLMERHPAARFLANIAPGNTRSIAMFERLGFELIQFTFEKRRAG